MDKDFFAEDMKKYARASTQMARLRFDSGEKMHIIKNPRVDIPPIIEPPLPPDLIVDCDNAQNKIKRNMGDH